MKKNIDSNKEKISKVMNWLTKTWFTILIVVTLLVFAVLSLVALYPRLDPAYIEEGMAKVKALDIRFDTKLLDELSATKQPSELKASGGRDPFAGY